MNLDREKTQVQETGGLAVGGYTLADLIEVADDLGISSRDVVFREGSLFVRDLPEARRTLVEVVGFHGDGKAVELRIDGGTRTWTLGRGDVVRPGR